MSGLATAGISITMLGCFELTRDGSVVRLPLQAQRVIAYLVVSGVVMDRHRLAELLWPSARTRRAQSNLRTALWRIRRDAPGVLVTDRCTVGLSDGVVIDSVDLLDWDSDVRCGMSTRDLVSRLRNDLLPGWDEDWLVIERERIRQMRARELEVVSRRCREEGDMLNAILAAYGAIWVEPLRESAHLILIEAHVADGNRAEAVRELARTVTLLGTELDIEPSPQFWKRSGELGLPLPWAAAPDGVGAAAGG